MPLGGHFYTAANSMLGNVEFQLIQSELNVGIIWQD